MTHRKNGRGKKLPDYIVLKDPIPGEASVMQKRRSPIALRFHQVKANNDPERYFHGEVMLYYPLRREVKVSEATEMYEETFDGFRKVQLVKNQVMEHLQGIEVSFW